MGVKSGVGVCPLPHWEDCDGDIPEGQEARGQIWAPCPKDDPVVTSSDDSRSRSNSGSSTEIEIDEKNRNKDNKLPENLEVAAKSMEDAISDKLSSSVLSKSVLTSSVSIVGLRMVLARLQCQALLLVMCMLHLWGRLCQ